MRFDTKRDEVDVSAVSEEPGTVRQVKGSIAKTVLSYVRRVLGPEAVAEVLERAGQLPGAAGLDRPASWTSFQEAIAIAEAAEAVCGDGDIGRRGGEELMRMTRERGTVDFVRATGSVAAALEMTTNAGTKMSSGRVLELAEVGEDSAVIIGTYLDPADAHPFFCGHSAGYYGLVPDVFGYAGVITETECMTRGQSRCVYKLRWSTATADEPAVDTEAIDVSRARMESFVARFEQLHTMATELAGAEQVDTVLASITTQAGIAVDAHRYLLAVRTREHGPVRIHHSGFEADSAERFAQRLLAGELVDTERVMVADVASPGHFYGRLAALYPRGASVNDMERRLLSAYARHAAAALEAVASLESARRDRDAAEALLGLAEALAEVGSKEDVARRLAAAIPAVAASDQAAVWFWDAEADLLRLVAESSDSRELPNTVFRASDVASLGAIVRNPTPMVINVGGADPAIRRAMEADGLGHCAVVPIQARGEFLGLVTAGFVDIPDGEGGGEWELDLLARLRGLADQAATALDNADLLERVREQALHDTLTGLPNRRLLAERAAQALLHLGRSGKKASLLFIDLDRFKNVNDTYGHEAGDDLIREAAARINRCLRASDTVARIGGDEFVVLLPDLINPGDATVVAEKVLRALREPFKLNVNLCDREVFVSGSIGIAVAPQHGSDYTTLVQRADTAMYRAKQAGGGTYSMYDAGARPREHDQVELDVQLDDAIARGELALLYQPQLEMRSLEVVGVEALVRWDHPVLGRLGAHRFVPIAEQNGVITKIDAWVRRTALRQLATWHDAGLNLRLGVNVAGATLADPLLADDLAGLLLAYGLTPDMIELEISDKLALPDDELAALLAPLDDLGIRLAIDDFGTGASVLGRLQHCRFDTIKVDRAFVNDIGGRSASAPVVSAVLAMAAGLGLDVVAEGVETAEQHAFLAEHRCRRAQGFFFSPPVEADAIEQLVRRSRPAGGRGPSADDLTLRIP